MTASRLKIKPTDSLQKLNDQLIEARIANNQVLIKLILAVINKIKLKG